ncbi:MAG: hypothetical protein LBK23_00770 [Oscillospiraceae bacterium]|jgi:hypothetical protein|nr:hypothetical protein [Oscillospiraceae bacterium]
MNGKKIYRLVIPAAACLALAAGAFFVYGALNPALPDSPILSIRADGPESPERATKDPSSRAAGGEPVSRDHSADSGAVSVGNGAPAGAELPPSDLVIDPDFESAACYAPPDDWRGLPAEDFILEEQSDGAADRMAFTTLQELAEHADAFVVVPRVRETAPDGDNLQSAIAEYAGSIGDVITTRQWDDRTVSTGSRILLRQILIGGCVMNEPNNLLRAGGVYLLPVKLDPYLGAYRVVGDLDVLFELDDAGKIVSHSRYPELNKYDGEAFSALLDAVRALYPPIKAEFIEQPINSAEQAEIQLNAAYISHGFRKFSAEFEKETVIKGADAYLFIESGSAGFTNIINTGRRPGVAREGDKVSLGAYGFSEYAVIAKKNGAFIRGDFDSNGELTTLGGSGLFPKNSR